MGTHKLYDVPTDIECKECGSEHYLAEIKCPSCEARPALTTKTDNGAEVTLDCGVSNNAIVDLMKRMEQGDGEPQWISCGETVFEALWALVEESEGRERLAREFPHYC